MRARFVAPAGVLLLTAVFRLLHGPGYLGYDAYWSLVWGGDIAHGRGPDFERLLAPTPHPLAIVVGALATPFGDASIAVLEFLAYLSLGALVWATGLAGARLFGLWVGIAAAVLVATRTDLAAETLYASIDIPFAALVIGALAVEARGERPRPVAVLTLLALAGLLRPEAWGFSVAYAAWIAYSRRDEWSGRVMIPLALAGPVVWMLFDLFATGNPLHSLQGTQALAEQLERPRSVGTALEVTPSYLRSLLDSNAVFWGGIAGAATGLWIFYERAILPFALLVLSIVAFLALGVADLPLLIRYLLLPSVVLCLFAAVAWAGFLYWRPSPMWRLWLVGSLVFTVWWGIDASDREKRQDSIERTTAVRRHLQDDLEDLARLPITHELAKECGPLYVPNHQLIPPLARELDLRVDQIVSAQLERPERGLIVSPATATAQRGFAFDPREPRRIAFVVPRDFEPVAGNGAWTLYRRC